MSANNVVMLCGRLTRDPEVRYTTGDNAMAIARYSLAVDRGVRRDANSDQPTADFINCVAFGKSGEFAEKYLKKGTKILVRGHWQTGSYTNDSGVKVYTNDCVIDEQTFAESKSSQEGSTPAPTPNSAEFNNIPEGIESELPFK